MHLPVGTQLQGGRYEILRYISSGGFGCTYEARDTKFRSRVKSVAIKEFFVKDFCNRDTVSNSVVVGTQSKKELVEKLRNKFLEEADAIFELEHPNIVRVTDTFEENGTAYYVMEYINGSTLASIIEKEGALSEDKALGYICQIADALCHIHSRNRLHLDVKPGNIMIDQSGKAVLIDFGVSKQYDEVCGENTSTLMGFTPGYAPLEQSNKGIREFSPTTDIYSLGATLYKLVTGQTPPDASDVNEDGLPALPQGISAPVRVAIEAAMQPRRKDRPQSVAEFLKLLENGGKSKDERAKSKDETLLNSSSTPGGEVSRSDGGESELPTEKIENAKNYTASSDDEETQVGMNPPRPSATPPFQKVEELSKADSDDDETLVNRSSTPEGEVSRSGGGESELKTENRKSKLPLIIIILLLSVILGAGGYMLYSGGGGAGEDTPKPPQSPVVVEEQNPETTDTLQTVPPVVVEPEKKTTPLYVTTPPSGATVKIDGKVIGKTPLSGYEIEQDKHTISIAKEGCEQKTEVRELKSDTELSSDLTLVGYVDLGLNVKWAACNIGANSPEDYGNFYDWDESQQLMTDNRRLPTEKELRELKDKCNWEWSTEKGVNGYKVTGPNGNSIFLPAAGLRGCFGDVVAVGFFGYYWSSSPGGSEYAWGLGFYSGSVLIGHFNRCQGSSVRLVQD